MRHRIRRIIPNQKNPKIKNKQVKNEVKALGEIIK